MTERHNMISHLTHRCQTHTVPRATRPPQPMTNLIERLLLDISARALTASVALWLWLRSAGVALPVILGLLEQRRTQTAPVVQLLTLGAERHQALAAPTTDATFLQGGERADGSAAGRREMEGPNTTEVDC